MTSSALERLKHLQHNLCGVKLTVSSMHGTSQLAGTIALALQHLENEACLIHKELEQDAARRRVSTTRKP